MKQTLIIAGMAGMVVCCAAVPVLLVGLGSFSLGGVLGYFDASLLPWGIGCWSVWLLFASTREDERAKRGIPANSLLNLWKTQPQKEGDDPAGGLSADGLCVWGWHGLDGQPLRLCHASGLPFALHGRQGQRVLSAVLNPRNRTCWRTCPGLPA